MDGDVDDWKLTGPYVFIEQMDGHSCGPIACIKMMSLFGRVPSDVNVHSVPAMELRKIVMNDFRKVCQEIDSDICVRVPKTKDEETKKDTIEEDEEKSKKRQAREEKETKKKMY